MSYNEYPELFNSSYFEDEISEISMNTIEDSKLSLTEKEYDILGGNGSDGVDYSFNNTLLYAQDLNIIVYTDQDFGSFNQLCIYNLANKTRCTEKIGDAVSLNVSGIPYLTKLNGEKFFLYSMVHSIYDQDKDDYIYSPETFVFRIADSKITMTDRLTGIINYGGGELSSGGFYMNSYEEMFVDGLDKDAWNSLPQYMLTEQGKIVRKK